jgi:XRE family aerobic/anaerobic benzoate catabolism transcriptional regulator
MPRAEKAEKQARSDNTRLLAEIGALVRTERLKRGITRKVLARHCQTSERYLGQIETGEANPSVLVLDAVARALDLDPIDLMPAGREARSRARLPAGAPNRARRIALVGLRGAGKSTLGAMLAEKLGCPFIELDKMIEQDHGAPIATLFDVYGQGTFRRYERECLTRVVATNPAAVIATAGGIVADEASLSQLLDQAHVVWVQASPADHMRRVMEQGDFRPMAHNRDAMKDLVAILEARAPEYGRAHATLDTSGKSIEVCVGALTKLAEQLFAQPA